MPAQINLYDPALRRRRDPLALGNLVLAAVVSVIIIGAWAYAARLETAALRGQQASTEQQLQAVRAQTTALGQQISGRRVDTAIERELAELRAQLALRNQILDALQRTAGAARAAVYAEYLRGLARQAPQGLWLTEFSVMAPGEGLAIRGRMLDPALLPEYIRRLNRETAFQGLGFAALNMHVAEGAAAGDAGMPRHHEFLLAPTAAPESGSDGAPGAGRQR